MNNPKYWAQIALQDMIFPDNVSNLEKMQTKYKITDEQKEQFRQLANDFINKVQLVIKL